MELEEFFEKKEVTAKDVKDITKSFKRVEEVFAYVRDNISEKEKEYFSKLYVSFLDNPKIDGAYKLIAFGRKYDIAIGLLAIRATLGKRVL